MDKKSSEAIHFKRRLFERYGLVINRDEYHQMIRKVKGGKNLVERLSNRLSKHNIFFQGQRMDVIYDKMRHSLVTVYDPDWVEIE